LRERQPNDERETEAQGKEVLEAERFDFSKKAVGRATARLLRRFRLRRAAPRFFP
jgi:hypothetical protein